MPQLNWTAQGVGPAVVLGHGLGADLSMWDEVAGRLAKRFRVLRYDHRGHGASAKEPLPFEVEDLADDTAALLAAQCDAPVHFVGHCLGGMVAQQFAVRHPQLVASIVVANASSGFDDTARGMWRARVETVRNHGMEGVADLVLARWLTREYRATEAGAARTAALREVLLRNAPQAYAASCEAIARIDFAGTNRLIACPALVIAGARDDTTPAGMSDVIRDQISGAQLATLPTAHLSPVERPDEFAQLVARFIHEL
jgi:3-oxoadipate enol-lactonase